MDKQNEYVEALDIITDWIDKRWTKFRHLSDEEIREKINESIYKLEELVEKTVPKKVEIRIEKYISVADNSLIYENKDYFCPECGLYFKDCDDELSKPNMCPDCGQTLDWSEN